MEVTTERNSVSLEKTIHLAGRQESSPAQSMPLRFYHHLRVGLHSPLAPFVIAGSSVLPVYSIFGITLQTSVFLIFLPPSRPGTQSYHCPCPPRSDRALHAEGRHSGGNFTCGPRHELRGTRISRALLPMEVALPRDPDVSTDVHSHGNRRNPADGHHGLTSPSSDLRTRCLKSSQLTSLRTQNAGLLWPPITH